MKQLPFSGITLLAAISAVAGDAVGNGQTTNALSFGGFPGPYNFQRAASVDYNNGSPSCPLKEVKTDDGPLAPLTSEMHYIFRGPLNLLQFGVYQVPASQPSSQKKRSAESQIHRHRHHHVERRAHRHGKEQDSTVEKRGCGAEVTALIDGKVVTFEDTWDCKSSSVPVVPSSPVVPLADTPSSVAASVETVTAQAIPASVEAISNSLAQAPSNMNSQAGAAKSAAVSEAGAGAVQSEVNNGRTTYSSPVTTICPSSDSPAPSSAAASSAPASSPSNLSNGGGAGVGSWSRIAYFDAGSQQVNGIAFSANNNMTM